jgi:predicted amidohydrolase
MKVALAQINPIVGDIEGNRRKILEGIRRAESAHADLVVFPELAVTGYPPLDLLDRPSFVEANLASLAEIARRTGETAAIVGFVDRDRSGRTPGLLNAAALLHRGKILSVHAKSLLPTYDVFDEVRYFSPAAKAEPARLPQEEEKAKSTGGQAASGTKIRPTPAKASSFVPINRDYSGRGDARSFTSPSARRACRRGTCTC